MADDDDLGLVEGEPDARVAPADGRLDVLVAELYPELSRSRATALIKEGRVTVDGGLVEKPSAKVKGGALLTVDLPPLVALDAAPQDLPLTIVYQDDALVVVNKQAGMVVHPGAGHLDGTLVNALLFHVGGLSGIGGVARPGIVHRLDRGTSGLLVVAKTDAAHQALAQQFADHTAQRRYLALVHGVVRHDQQTLRSSLARHPSDRLRFASCADPSRGKPAVTHVQVLARAARTTLVACWLETGRTHQIRVHLTEAGHPLVGDGVYDQGAPPLSSALADAIDTSGGRPLLHAWSLALDHPTTRLRQQWLAPAPNDLRAALAAVGIADDALPLDAR